MTNTTQTDLLDGVEPDSFSDIKSMGAECNHGEAYICGNCTFKRVYFYSRETVEALLIANRKQVLLEAAEAYLKNDDDQLMNEYVAEWLRRMALETTGVDKGGNE